jgi:hypothetical protein
MTDRAVAAAAGVPSTLLALRRSREHAGRRVCFANGRVVRVWRAVHG